MKVPADRFIPTTMARHVGRGVYFRPIRSWHSGVLAGERKTEERGDASGCMFRDKHHGLDVATIPRTVTHRLYWHESNPEATISAFLSYPDAMGARPVYFWEANIVQDDGDGIARFDSEKECEEAIVETFMARLRKEIAGVP